MLWAYAWVRDMEKDRAGTPWWGLGAYLVLGFSVAFKLVPVVMLPFVLLSEVTTGGDLRRVAARSAAFAAGLAFPFVVRSPSAGLRTLDFLTYHLEQEIQIESVYTRGVVIMSIFGVPLAVANRPDTIDLISPAVPMMVRLSNVLSLAFVGALGMRRPLVATPIRSRDQRTVYELAPASQD